MAPLPALLTLLSKSHTAPSIPSDFAAAKTYWINPTDVLTVLMIIGGDIVQRALASMAGPRNAIPFVPVAYSFGWVSYSFSAILSTIGDRRLLPDPDFGCMLVNARSGYARQNRSFPLARLLRDHEPAKKCSEGLCIEFFETSNSIRTGDSAVDKVYIFSVLAIIAQLSLSVIPIFLNQHYLVFILTLGGTVLALLTAALPQWRKEKWGAREVGMKKGKKERTVACLTTGNGSNCVMVIINNGCGLKLEDLAAGRDSPMLLTSIATVVFAILWIIHLITVQALNTDSWISLAIGSLGMIQNAIAAGASRSPAALGFHLKSSAPPIYKPKVIEALKEAEKTEHYVGLSLLPIFFPGELRQEEITWRDNRKAELANLSIADKARNSQSTSPPEKATILLDEEATASIELVSHHFVQAIHSPDIALPLDSFPASPNQHTYEAPSRTNGNYDHPPGLP